MRNCHHCNDPIDAKPCTGRNRFNKRMYCSLQCQRDHEACHEPVRPQPNIQEDYEAIYEIFRLLGHSTEQAESIAACVTDAIVFHKISQPIHESVHQLENLLKGDRHERPKTKSLV